MNEVTNWIFDRLATPDHSWSKAMSDLEKVDDIGTRALCSNLQMDFRVSESREQHMLDAPQFYDQPDGEDLLKQWRDYFQSSICQPANSTTGSSVSAYMEPHNDKNRISNRCMSFDLLIHVGSLNRILWRLATSEYGSATVFGMDFYQITGCTMPKRKPEDTYMDRTNFNTSVDTVAENLIGQGEGVMKEMAGLLCDTLGDRQPPWWACFAEEVAPYIQTEDWAGLCKSLGLGHFAENEWIIIWQYEVGTAGDLFRPTVVESNDSPYHYPSPLSSQYGVTMPLGLGFPLCREVIHPPLSGTPAIEACTGELCKIKGFPVAENGLINDVPEFRLNHHERLEDEFTSENDQDWLERHKATKGY